MFFSGHRGRRSLEDNAYDDGYDSLEENDELDRLEEGQESPETPESTSDDEKLYEQIRELTERRLSLLNRFGHEAHRLTEDQFYHSSKDTSIASRNVEEIDNIMKNISLADEKTFEDYIQKEEEELKQELHEHEDKCNAQRQTANNIISEITNHQQARLRALIDAETQREEQAKKAREEEMKRKKAEEEARERERIAKQQRIEQEEKERLRQQEEKERLRLQEERERLRLQEEKKRKEKEEAAQREKQELLDRQRVEAERIAKVESDKLAPENTDATAEQKPQQQTVFSDFKQVEQEFYAYKDKIEDIKKNIVIPVQEDKQLKSYTFNAKRRIKPKLGQLSDSKKHLQELSKDVDEVLNATRAESELAYLWLLNFLAKSIVSQAETETIVSLQSAIPLGMFCMSLLVKHTELKSLLIARFVKKCPQCIGYSCSIDTEEGRRRMGWKRRNEKWEEETVYSERISGMICVWAVITQSKLGANSEYEHPYPISNSWKFLARQMNKDPKLLQNSDYAAVAGWWDISAKRFLDVYGKQGSKILKLAWDQWTAISSEHKYPAAARLRLLGEDWAEQGVITVKWKQMSA